MRPIVFPALNLAPATAPFVLFALVLPVLVLGLYSGRAGAQQLTTAQNVAQQDGSPCLVEGRKTIDPDVLLVGERVTVTLHARAACTGLGIPLHSVLVLDSSLSMSGF